jgi:hypothetical protein
MKKILILSMIGISIATSAFAEITLKDVKNTSSSINHAKIRQGYIDQALLAGASESIGDSSSSVPSFGTVMKNSEPSKVKQLDIPNDFFINEKQNNKSLPPIKL